MKTLTANEVQTVSGGWGGSAIGGAIGRAAYGPVGGIIGSGMGWAAEKALFDKRYNAMRDGVIRQEVKWRHEGHFIPPYRLP
ncbi:hypothetical protein [Cardiobacterium hominis]